MLNFTLKLIYDENKEIKFGDKEKKNSIRELFAWIFSTSKSFRKKQKTREQHIKNVLAELKKRLSQFSANGSKSNKKKKKKKEREKKTIQDYVRLLKLTKILKEKIATTGKERQIKKEK